MRDYDAACAIYREWVRIEGVGSSATRLLNHGMAKTVLQIAAFFAAHGRDPVYGGKRIEGQKS